LNQVGVPEPRQAKGQNLVLLVKMLRSARREGRLHHLEPDVARLLEERVIMTSWYPFEHFAKLLVVAHQRLADGTEEAARKMGDMAASEMLLGMHKSFLAQGDPSRTLAALERVWPRYFNFGALRVHPGMSGARVVIGGYGDMTSTHGNVLAGWARTAVGLSGAEVNVAAIRRAPWQGDALFEVWTSWHAP
jgi:uncharacterized protein (TIGR02265 family)